MITKPSLSDMEEERRTKIKGKAPRVNVIIKLIHLKHSLYLMLIIYLKVITYQK